MKVLRNLKEKLNETRMFNQQMRIIFCALYRVFFNSEKANFKKYVDLYKSRELIALNIGQYAYFYEHIRDLVELLRQDHQLFPLLVSSTKWPIKKSKIATFDLLSKRYKLFYGKNIFGYPWLKYTKIKAFFDVSPSSYGCDNHCPQILYAHGMGGRGFGKSLRSVSFLSRYSALFLTGPIQRKAILMSQKIYGSELPRMYEIGYLKGDRLLKMLSSFDKKAFLEKLKLPFVPTVLYAPTWGEFASPEDWLKRVVEVSESMGVNLLVKLHPIMLNNKDQWRTGGIAWDKELVDIELNTRQVKIFWAPDIDEVLLASDVMITDVSGMALEFMTLDKPIVFLPAPRYFELYGEERPEKWCRPDHEIQTNSELKRELEKAIEGKGYRFPVEELVYNRGKALDFMLQALREIVKE
jgi:hypothetical protein